MKNRRRARGVEATYLHGKDTGRGVGHGGKALDAGEGRGGNSEHGELHGLQVDVRQRDGPQVRNCERRKDEGGRCVFLATRVLAGDEPRCFVLIPT